MNITLPQAVFLFLAAVIVVCSILTVTTKRILRSATYLLFVLFATAGIYFELNYSFLGAVQLTVYAGGIKQEDRYCIFHNLKFSLSIYLNSSPEYSGCSGIY